jgi:hypothetical protein
MERGFYGIIHKLYCYFFRLITLLYLWAKGSCKISCFLQKRPKILAHETL